nr:glutathione hydrolase 1 proenzyme-like [Misgurnus anguillicaudatus]
MIIDWVLRQTVGNKRTGIRWNLTTVLEDLHFANDIALLSSTFDQLQTNTTRLFKTLVLSTLLYGCETWKLTKGDEKKLDTLPNKCLKRILRIHWQQHVTNERVRELAEIGRVRDEKGGEEEGGQKQHGIELLKRREIERGGLHGREQDKQQRKGSNGKKMSRLYAPSGAERIKVKVRFVLFGIAVIILVYFLRRTQKPPEYCYLKAAVAADAGTCSDIGRDILLMKNGSVVDAAIAALLCVGLINVHNMGIGGGVVFTIYNASTGKVEVIDARETAPIKSSAGMFNKYPEKAKSGVLSIAVPGEIHGYWMAHKRHGRLKWTELFEPSIKMARDGFKISSPLANAIERKRDMILNDTTWCEVFCKSNNTIWKENDTIRLLKLADTYEQIANGGPDVFYNGSLGQKIVKDIKDAGGIITSEDLQGYESSMHEYALNFTVRNYTFHVPNAPFSGPVLAMMIKILNGYNISSSSLRTTESMILTYHRIIEAFRFAYARKGKLGDPRHVNVTNLIQEMISDKFADNIRRKIDDTTTKSESYYGHNSSSSYDYGTSHLSIIAEDGSAVAVTSTINDHFGSQVMSPSTGIIFNNQMRDFSYPEKGKKINKNNLIGPGKRPLSSMCPTIILDNSQPKHKRVKMVAGASGGPNITTATAMVILKYLFFENNLKKAVNEPRVHISLENITYVENNFDSFDELVLGLERKNHKIIWKNISLGRVQAAVRKDDNWLCAESDHRKGKDVHPAGY